ncbi:type II secretion system protein GspC [Oceanicoccus sagamiensis]|uniref:Type II secretion system protein GspC n=1 Tax=Oceanicoccus sagamiensis TaxID=716816 RepID=A0A1X9NB45_9GAMM|nr:type II secretion system protein GspC [Oceanicoccus sagamiensis]ARN74836.1 type II secretion system protein GspC [Oceanicoccus sagamiensis]
MTAEQVTARVAMIVQQLTEVAKSLPVQSVNKAVCGVLIVWLLITLGQLTTVFIASDTMPVEAADPAEPATLKPASKTDISQLQSINLFGVAGAVPLAPVESVPVADEMALNATKTKLKLSLEGIVYTPDDDESLAVIVYQNKQDQYYIGDKLPVGNKVTLARVMADHVILDNSGRYESLWLYDDEKKAAGKGAAAVSRPASKAVTDKRNNNDATKLATGYRDRLYKNPSSLAEVLRISPAQKNGQMLGYRVSAGRDRKQFAALGFKANDIVTSINGIELDEPSKALQIYKLMRTAKEATFVVDRNGSPVEVLVSLGEDQ